MRHCWLKQEADGLYDDELGHLDECLVAASKQIELAQGERQMMNSVINHDLRTPLGSINLVLDMTQAGLFGTLSPEDMVIVSEAESQVRNLLSKVDHLLTLEKLDVGKLELHLKPMPVREEIQSLLDSLDTALIAKHPTVLGRRGTSSEQAYRER